MRSRKRGNPAKKRTIAEINEKRKGDVQALTTEEMKKLTDSIMKNAYEIIKDMDKSCVKRSL